MENLFDKIPNCGSREDVNLGEYGADFDDFVKEVTPNLIQHKAYCVKCDASMTAEYPCVLTSALCPMCEMNGIKTVLKLDAMI